MKKILGITGLVAISSMSFAEYQMEAGAVYSSDKSKYDGQSEQETKDVTLAGTFYFDAVDDSKAPLGAAAFIGRNSFVTGGFISGETEDEDHSGVFGGIEIVVPNTNFRLGAELSTYEDDDIETAALDLTLGYYVQQNGLLHFGLGSSHSEFDGGGEYDQGSMSVGYQQYISLNDTGMMLESEITFFGGEYEDSDVEAGGVIVHLSGEYFFTREFSAGIGMNVQGMTTDYGNDIEETESSTQFVASASYFVTNNVEIFGTVSALSGEAETDGLGDDSEEDFDGSGFSLGANVRF